MPGKDKKNQRDSEIGRKKAKLTPEQQQAVEREEYVNSLKHVRNIINNGYDTLNRYFGQSGKMPDGMKGKETYDRTRLPEVRDWPEHFVTAVAIGAMMDPEYLNRAMTSSGFAAGSSTYVEFNQNYLVESIPANDKRFGWFPQVLLSGRNRASNALIRFLDSKNPDMVYAYLNNFVQFAAHQVKNSPYYSSRNLVNDFEYTGYNYAYRIAAEIIETEPFKSNIRISEFDRMKLMAFKHQTDVKNQLIEEKAALMSNPPVAGSTERENAVAELMFKEYLLGLAVHERNELYNEQEQIFTEILDLQGLDPTVPEYERLSTIQGGIENCRFRMNANISQNRTTDREVILSRPDGVETLRNMYMESIRSSETFKNLVNAEGTEFQDQLIRLDRTASKGLTDLANIPTSGESAAYNRMNGEAFGRNNNEISRRIGSLLDGMARRNHLITTYDEKSLARNRRRVDGLLREFTKHESAFPDDTDLKAIRSGLRSLLDQASSMEKAGKAAEDNLKAYTTTIDTILGSIRAFRTGNGASGNNDKQLDMLRMLRRMERNLKWNKSGIMEPVRIKERERILRENAKTYAKPVKEGIDALVRIRREEQEARMLDATGSGQILISRAMNATARLGEMIKAGTPLTGEEKTAAIGYLKDILAERVYTKAYSGTSIMEIYDAERYAGAVAEKLPGFRSLTQNLSAMEIGEFVFEGGADRMLESLTPAELSARFEQEPIQESQAMNERILREDAEQRAREKREREQRERREYKEIVLRRQSDYMENNRRIVEAYGPRGHFPSGIRLSEEYNALTIDVPKGLDENTVTAIVLGSIMQKKRMDHQITNSSVGGGEASFTDFNRNFLIDNLVGESPDIDRQGSFGLALVEGRKDAIKAINDFKNGNPEPAKAMLRTFLDFSMIALEMSVGTSAEKLSSISTITQQLAMIQLGTGMIGKAPFHLTVEGSECKKITGMANEQVMQTAYRICEEKPGILNNPKAPNSTERIREIEDLMFREYLVSSLSVEVENKQRAGYQYANKIREDHGYSRNGDRQRSREYTDVAGDHEARISWNFRVETVTDLEVLLSTKDGIRKLRELYMPHIRKTKLYRDLIRARGEEYEDLFRKLDKEASKGLRSFKDVELPPAAKTINDRNRKVLEEKNREHEIAIDKAVDRMVREEIKISGFTRETLEKNARLMSGLNDRLDKEELQDRNLSTDMRKPLSTIRTSVATYVRLAEEMAKKKKPVTEEELRKYMEYADFLKQSCDRFLLQHKPKEENEAERKVTYTLRRVRNIARADAGKLMDLYQAKLRKDRMAVLRKNLSGENLREMGTLMRKELELTKDGKSTARRNLIDKSGVAVEALSDMMARGEEYLTRHREEAGQYLRDIMAERILKVMNDLRFPLLEADRYMGKLVDKIPEMKHLLENITVDNIRKITFDGHADHILTKYREEMADSNQWQGKLRTWVDEVYLEKYHEERTEIENREKPVAGRKNEINPEEEVIRKNEEERERIHPGKKEIKNGKKNDLENDIEIDEPDPENDNLNEINLEEEVMARKTERKSLIHLGKKGEKLDLPDPENDNLNEINLEPEEENHNVIKAKKLEEGDEKKKRQKRDLPPADTKKKIHKAPPMRDKDPGDIAKGAAKKAAKEAPKGAEKGAEKEAEKEAPKDAGKEAPLGRNKILHDELFAPPAPVIFEELHHEEEQPAMQEVQAAGIGEAGGHGPDQEHHGLPEIPEEIHPAGNPVSALDYIENIRDTQFPVINTFRITDAIKNDYGDKFLRIIAARQLADSVRNYSDRLSSYMLTPQQVEERVDLMKNDAVFRGFIDDIKNNRYKLITAINGAKMRPGHGGKLDDMLKEYMLNLPPGELKNSKLHERYMPKAEERIKSIQDHVKRLNKLQPATEEEDERKDHQLSCAVAEILEIRNLVRAEGEKKEPLSHVIPCTQEDTLKQKITGYADRESFRMTSLHRDVQGVVSKGYGSRLTMKARELDAQRDTRNLYPCHIITDNSIEGRMKKLEQRAGNFAENLRGAQAGSNEQRQHTENGRKLLEEYTLLFAKVVNPENYEVVPDKLLNDVPWEKVRDLQTKTTQFKRMFRRVFDRFDPNEVADCLDLMAASDLNSFKNNVNTKIGQLRARLQVEQPQANHQEQPQANHQANPQANHQGNQQVNHAGNRHRNRAQGGNRI